MKLNQLKLGLRLGSGFGLVLLFSVGIAIAGWTRLSASHQSMVTAESMEHQASLAQKWEGLTRLNVARALAIAKANGDEQVNNYFAPQMKETSAAITAILDELAPTVASPEGKALLADIEARRAVYVKQRAAVMQKVVARDPQANELLETQVLSAAQGYLAAIDKLQQHQTDLSKAQNAAATAGVMQSQGLLVGLSLLCLAVGALCAWAITRSVTTPLAQAVHCARAMAKLDLSQPIDVQGRDEVVEVLRAMSDMQTALRSLVVDVRASTDSVGTASSEIATGNADLASRTEQTASSLQQTASSMEQITATLQQSVQSARTASQLAASAATAAEEGGTVVAHVVSTLNDINTSSKKVVDIIAVIDGIAFQTNILALNAAVEAARAGEQGRGFAVVANEVRALAQRSAAAAKEIKTLIAASVESVASGSKLVDEAGRAMTGIVASVKRVSDVIGEITTAAAEQSQGIGSVNAAVASLDQMTQQNAALVEQSAAAAESLRDQALRLSGVVDTFKLDPQGAG